MTACLISLGSNLGDRRASLAHAIDSLKRHPALQVHEISRCHETRAVGGPGGQETYLNAALTLESELDPRQLLDVLLDTEARLGRRRSQRWGPRTIDLDLLLFGMAQIRQPELVVPHPRLSYRRFVLEPAVEVAAQWVHPELRWSLRQLLHHLRTAIDYVALAGPSSESVRQLASAICRDCPHCLVCDPAESQDEISVPQSRQEVEFHQRRAESLRRVHDLIGRPDVPFVVSDFWWEAGVMCPSEMSPAALSLCASLRRQVPSPKLLAVVAPPPSDADGGQLEEYAALERYLAEHPAGPTLRVSASDLKWAQQELAAAIAAMRG